MSQPIPLGEYMTATDVTPEGRKTAVFHVRDRHGGKLGEVKWYGAWRQFCFFPDGPNRPVFNNDCLNRISAFMRLCTIEQRESRVPRDGHA